MRSVPRLTPLQTFIINKVVQIKCASPKARLPDTYKSVTSVIDAVISDERYSTKLTPYEQECLEEATEKLLNGET